jgi:hypothetical protein
VNPEYGFDGAPPTADGISYELGHKIYVSLVVDLDGLVTNLRLQDLKTLSLTPDQAHALALQNLEREWKAGRLKPTGFATPTGQKFVLVPDNWLASSCILLPQLSSLANSYLGGSGPVLVSVPHRNTMLVFPIGTAESRAEMRAIIRDRESNQPHPRTMELFQVENGKVVPFSGP